MFTDMYGAVVVKDDKGFHRLFYGVSEEAVKKRILEMYGPESLVALWRVGQTWTSRMPPSAESYEVSANGSELTAVQMLTFCKEFLIKAAPPPIRQLQLGECQ